MIMSVMKEKDNFFIVNEKEIRSMLMVAIREALRLLDDSRLQTDIMPGITSKVSILSLEQKEFIINKAITEEMKKMETETD